MNITWLFRGFVVDQMLLTFTRLIINKGCFEGLCHQDIIVKIPVGWVM